MSKESPCCAHCFNSLAKKYPSAALFWMELCDFYMRLGGSIYPRVLLCVNGSDGTDCVLSVLENSGFLISTENNKELLVKLLGYKSGTFCLVEGEHD